MEIKVLQISRCIFSYLYFAKNSSYYRFVLYIIYIFDYVNSFYVHFWIIIMFYDKKNKKLFIYNNVGKYYFAI